VPRGSLPGYVWDKAKGVYRRLLANGALGGTVSSDEIVGGLREIAAASEKTLGDLSVAVLDGGLTVNDGVLAGNMFLKDLYNAYSALARGGWSKMDFASWGRNGQLLRGEYKYWRDFMSAIASDKLSEAQTRARAALYVGKAYSRYWAEDRLMKLQNDEYQFEEWHSRDDPVVCFDCLALEALGKVPIGTIRAIPGDGTSTACRSACRCSVSYS